MHWLRGGAVQCDPTFPVERHAPCASSAPGPRRSSEQPNPSEVRHVKRVSRYWQCRRSARLKAVLVGNEERQVAELRVFFDEYRQDGSGGVESAGGSGSM